MSDQTPDECQPPSFGARIGSLVRRSPGDRINAMKAADQDAATAAPFMIAVPDHPAALEAVQQISQRLGEETANRRYLLDLVDRLLVEADKTAQEYIRRADAHKEYDKYREPNDIDDADMRVRHALAEASSLVVTRLNMIMDGNIDA